MNGLKIGQYLAPTIRARLQYSRQESPPIAPKDNGRSFPEKDRPLNHGLITVTSFRMTQIPMDYCWVPDAFSHRH
jgi:hypothetical protein